MDLIQNRIQHYDELLSAARGDIPVDLLIEGGKILNVLTGEIVVGDLAIHKGFIVSMFMKNVQANQKIDARGKIALPAFIDPHVHIESSMVLPPSYVEVVAANGTGTIFADPHEIVNVMGVEGFAMMSNNTPSLPVRLFFDIPTCVPSKRGAETSGADIQAPEIRAMADLGGRKLGELMSFDEITTTEPVMSEIVKTGWKLGLPRDSHFPMINVLGGLFNTLSVPQKLGVIPGMLASSLLHWPGLSALPVSIFTQQLRKQSYPELNAYLMALGLTADHETYGPEIRTKLDHGMRLMISSHVFLTLPQMMPILLQVVRQLRYKDAIGCCTDDIWPDDLITMGGMAGVLRLLAKNGIHPVDAVRFATLNNAQRLAQAGIAEAAYIGLLAPGMSADIALVDEPLKEFRVSLVVHEGKVVAKDGKLTQAPPAPVIPEKALHTVRVASINKDTFRIAAPAGLQKGMARVRVLQLPKPPALPFPEMVENDVPVVDGELDVNGYVLIAVFNRYGDGQKPPTIGLIQGYTLKAGAVASTLAHDSHNLIILGTNLLDMTVAGNEILKMNGGMVAAKDGKILAALPFPVGGLMTTGSIEPVAALAANFRTAIGSLGLDPKSPILPFAVFSLPAGPGAKVTDCGIWDADSQKLVPLFV